MIFCMHCNSASQLEVMVQKSLNFVLFIFLMQNNEDCPHSNYYCHDELNDCRPYVLTVDHVKCHPDFHISFCGTSLTIVFKND